MRTQNGFTLVEFMATLAVATVLLGIGAPAVGRLVDSARCSTALSRLTTSLATARIEAIRRNRPVSVCPSSTGQSCRSDRRWDGGWIVFVDDGSGQPAGPDSVIERADATGRLAIAATVGRPLVRYQPDGWSAGTNSTIRICTTGREELVATVTINNSGRTRSERFANTPCPFTQ